MSRSLLALSLVLVALPQMAKSQYVPVERERTVSAEQVFAAARESYGPPGPKVDCQPQQGDEIIVCADEPDDPEQHRIGSSLERGDDSHLSRDARAPDFAAPPCVPSLLTLCPKFGSVPPPAYLIDFSTLPETPAGSDAERVGQGLAPLGDSGADSGIIDPEAEPE